MCSCDTKDNITVRYIEVENELCRQRAEEKGNKRLLLNG
jgi:hypothetical protein